MIPGSATLSLEVRDLQMPVIDRLFASMQRESNAIATATGTKFEFNETYRTEPAAASGEIQDEIRQAATQLKYSNRFMPSGAGHDAQEIAPIAPMGMIFIPSRDGISHSALEYSSPADIERGLRVLLWTITGLR